MKIKNIFIILKQFLIINISWGGGWEGWCRTSLSRWQLGARNGCYLNGFKGAMRKKRQSGRWSHWKSLRGRTLKWWSPCDDTWRRRRRRRGGRARPSICGVSYRDDEALTPWSRNTAPNLALRRFDNRYGILGLQQWIAGIFRFIYRSEGKEIVRIWGLASERE